MNILNRLIVGGILSAMTFSHSAIRANESGQSLVEIYYWFDYQTQRSLLNPEEKIISTTNIAPGLHALHTEVTSNGIPTSINTAWFIKTLELNPGESYNTQIYIDEALHSSVSAIADENGTLNLSVDLNDIPVGLHRIMAQVLSPDGTSTLQYENTFLRVPTSQQLAQSKLYYLIDGVPSGEEKPIFNDNLFSINLDMSKLSSGLHSITSFLANPDGLCTSMETAWFLKVPLGGEGVKEYEYWINDDSTTTQKVILDKAANPFEMISLINVPLIPFSSQRYSFAIENGNPVIYSQNDWHIRFYDIEGRIINAENRYIDTRTRKELDITEIIEDNTVTSINDLEDNEIKWYKFTGEIGDLVGIKLDAPAMIEIYTPNGELLLERSGVDAQQYSSISLRENGIYYMAVHDISSHYQNTINVSFDHMPRNAIVKFTPEETAQNNLLIMTIQGNGFDNIKEIMLSNGDKIIPSTDISIETNNILYAIFDLIEKPIELGEYKILTKFDDIDRGEVEVISTKTLKVSDADKLGISVTINAPAIARTPYHIDIVVENNSNKSYFGIPLNIAMQDMSAGTKLETLNFALAQQSPDNIPVFYHTDNLLNTGNSGVYFPLILPYISPYEKRTYTIGLTSSPMEQYVLYTWAGTPWSEDIKEIQKIDITEDILAEKTSCSWMSVYDIIDLCYRSNIADSPDLIKQNNINFAPQDGQPPSFKNVVDAALTMGKSSVYVGGAEGQWAMNQRLAHTQAVLQSAGYTMGDDMYERAGLNSWDAMNAGFANTAQALMDAGNTDNNAIGNVQSLDHLVNARQQYKASLSHVITPKIGTSYHSVDPNEMYGYQSPSGSNFVGLDVEDIQYTIEFENDPEIANASASKIIIDNVIDLNNFDGMSLCPVSLRIGNKELDLPEEHHFIKTLDMRPEISAIAEVRFDYNPDSGLIHCELLSLDPYTMDETIYADSGILPVNDDSGKGLGFLTYQIKLRKGLSDATLITNKASIKFDDNQIIETPTCKNILDYERPKANVISVTSADNQIFEIKVEGSDKGSGIWYYDLYTRSVGNDQWTLVMTGIENDGFSWDAGKVMIDPEFEVVATDLASNRGDESFLTSLPGDADGNGIVDYEDINLIVRHYLDPKVEINLYNADVNHDDIIDAQDVTAAIAIILTNSDEHINQSNNGTNK